MFGGQVSVYTRTATYDDVRPTEDADFSPPAGSERCISVLGNATWRAYAEPLATLEARRLSLHHDPLDAQPASSAARAAAANAVSAGMWTAAAETVFGNGTIRDVRRRLGAEMAPPAGAGALRIPPAPAGRALRSDTIPVSFSAVQQWRNCTTIGTIRNQGNCGSCWAFAAVEALADRTCIASGGREDMLLAPQYLVDCDTDNSACKGGYLDFAWRYLQRRGAPPERCDPYAHCRYQPFTNCTPPPTLPPAARPAAPATEAGNCSACADGSTPRMYRARDAYAVARPGDVAVMQREIVAHGPIEVAFFVFSDFITTTRGCTGGRTKSWSAGTR